MRVLKNMIAGFLLSMASGLAFAGLTGSMQIFMADTAIETDKKETVCVYSSHVNNSKKGDVIIDKKFLDKKTKEILNHSDEILPLFSQPLKNGHNLVFIARIPSKSPQSTGYCGSGYEDHLILLYYDGKNLAFRDDFLLQSCLKSILLSNDNGDDILKSISINQQKYEIRFSWIAIPNDKNIYIKISNGKFFTH